MQFYVVIKSKVDFDKLQNKNNLCVIFVNLSVIKYINFVV